jgi:outer membrane receptor protein involved in Fe transport
MKDRFSTLLRTALTAFLAFSLVTVFTTAARADIVGRIHFSVVDADTGKPITGAVVTLHDSVGVHGDTNLTLDSSGAATSGALEIRPWTITTTAPGYDTDTRTFTVAADTTSTIEIDLAPQAEKVITITGKKTLVQTSKTTDSTVRNQTFIGTTPSGNGNSQSLSNLLIDNPGFVQSTNNQVHPRGEHASTTLEIDGAELPNATIGRGGQFLSPEVIQSADLLTGAYAPEYGSEAAAVINLNLRSGTITPFTDISLQAGGYATYDGDLTLGGQSGQPLESGVEDGPKDFRYFVDLNNRSTAAALEAPQPDDQTAHNGGVSSTLLGHFDYIADPNDQFSLTLNTTPATTEVANRTGLSSYFEPVGEGYGYGGARNANGYLPGWSAASIAGAPIGAYFGGNDNVASNGQGGIVSQQSAGQDIYQVDNNTFGLLNFRHNFDPETTGLVSFSETNSITHLNNNNPANNILNELNPDGTLTTTDNSIEFNPDENREYNQSQIQASVTKSETRHNFKAGFIYDNQTGQESYQFTPQSQLALDALANIYGFAAGPVVNPFVPTGVTSTGAIDALGNPVAALAGPGETFPVVSVNKDGYYGAAYLQDTWKESERFTVNYGVRLDSFHQVQHATSNQGYSNSTNLTTTELSPRFNTAYSLGGQAVARLSYDKLFTQPPLAQGAIVGYSIKPETWDQYEVSVEKQVSSGQTTKLDYYYKNIHNQDDTGILIPFTQIGALTTLNYQYASVHGVEYSYDVTPRNNVGVGGFLAYTYSIAKPGGLNEVGGPAPVVNDHNEWDTLSTGLNYTWQSKAYASATLYAGSGESSSGLVSVAASNGAPVLGPESTQEIDGAHPQPRSQVDVRLASSPKTLGFAGLQLDVVNLFNSLAVDNYNSGFSGTRFQQGRTVLLTTSAKF